MPVAPANAEQLAAMSRDADAFQAYALGPCASAVLARYAFWQELTQYRNVGAADATLSAALQSAGIVALIQEHEAQNAAAVKFAQVVAALNRKQLELAHWSSDEQNDGALTLGIVRAGSIPTELGWAFVPVIVIGVAAVGLWVVVNAWLSVRQLEAQNDALRAKTQAAVSNAVASVGVKDPQAARMLADALERANAAASGVQPGMLDKLAGAVGDAGRGLQDNATLLLLLGAAWAFSRRRAA
jgi:hypothetical protein